MPARIRGATPETEKPLPGDVIDTPVLFTLEELAGIFGLPDKLHAFKAADTWWADNVVAQFEGVDVFKPGAHEKLREWYERNARLYYQAKLEAKRRQEERQAMEAGKDGSAVH